MTITGLGVYLLDTNYNIITGNIFTDNGVGITCCNSIGIIVSGNTYSDNWLADTSSIDTGEMIMATTIYSCGPAALVNVLRSLGIMATEVELAELAGNDETGTSLYGLKTAALAKGATTVIGARLSTDQLETNYIVVLSIDGHNHFDVVQSINGNTITLFDPNLGIIELSIDKFNEIYTGVAFIVNDTVPPGTITLTDDEMLNIKAMGYQWVTHSYWVNGHYEFYWEKRTVSIPYPYLAWVPTYWIFGYYELRIGWFTYEDWFPVCYWVEGYWVEYQTCEYIPDEYDYNIYSMGSGYLNWDSITTSAAGYAIMAEGVLAIITGLEVAVGGSETFIAIPVGIFMVTWGCSEFAEGYRIMIENEDPWYVYSGEQHYATG